jgi:hypothetical protein
MTATAKGNLKRWAPQHAQERAARSGLGPHKAAAHTERAWLDGQLFVGWGWRASPPHPPRSWGVVGNPQLLCER